MESLSLDGRLVLDWSYAEGNTIAGKTQLRTLRLFVDESGTVVAVRETNGR